jgi:hypothetical protein
MLKRPLKLKENCSRFQGKVPTECGYFNLPIMNTVVRRKEITRKTKTRWVDNIKMDLTRGLLTGLIWLRLGTNGGL